MKKVIAAAVVQLLQFDSLQEMYVYIGNLQVRKIRYECHWHRELEDRKILLCISKAYNNTEMIKKEDMDERSS